MGLFSRRRPPSRTAPSESSAAPDSAEAHFARGNALREQGNLHEAIASYQRAADLRPDLAATHFNLANAQRQAGLIEPAIAGYRRAIERSPGFADAHHYLGNALHDTGGFAEAIACQRHALDLQPGFADAWLGLANAQTGCGDLEGAVASQRRAIDLDPARAMPHHDLGTTLYKQGRIDEAIASFRSALALKPDIAEAWTGLLFCLSHDERVDADALFEEHRRFGVQFDRLPVRSDHRNVRDPDRRLRIGFVSADFREHAVALFFEPILVELANRTSLSLHAYFNHAGGDGTTNRLMRHFERFSPVAGLSDPLLAQAIEGDAIDVLIDLSGHTAGSRLTMFALKPAPVQASWIGYLGTTGSSAIDYYFADARLLPPPRWANSFTESLVYLPAWAAFGPVADLPLVNALPALANGYVTFGSFNRMSKLSPRAVATWSRLLRSVPSARMLLGGMPPDGQHGELIARFEREGIARNRLTFHPRCDTHAYLALHHRVDIVLDSFPYAGGNTSTRALAMGVPVLTLAGSTPPSRQGAAIMEHAGLPEFVAHDTSQFERKGVYWAANLDELARLRAGLRARCLASPMARPEITARALEHALRVIWQRWCEGLPAASFTAPR